MAENFNLAVGGLETPEFLRDMANKTVGSYPVLAFCVLIVLTIVVLWLVIKSMTDHFNPTQNMRDQDSDQFGLGKKEHLEPSRGQSVFAQLAQSAAPAPAMPVAGAGSAAYQVLHSAEFDCANRKPISQEGAWDWLTSTAKENMSVASKPQTDNDFSKVLAGH